MKLAKNINSFKQEEVCMKRNVKWFKVVLIAILVFLPLTVAAWDINPIVSTDWLQENLTNPKLVIVDVRKVEEYRTGHIPGAVDVFYGSWAVKPVVLAAEVKKGGKVLVLRDTAGVPVWAGWGWNAR
jgi:thiosulfate/3-mercaptopyruvate sulfurtransferase